MAAGFGSTAVSRSVLGQSGLCLSRRPATFASNRTVIGRCIVPESASPFLSIDECAAPVPVIETTSSCTEVVKEKPVKSNAVVKFWEQYCEALDKNPIAVKSATSFFGFLIGDLSAQLISGGDYEFVRTLRMVLFGVLMDGPIGHVWYTNVDRLVMPTDPQSTKAVFIKTCLDQLAWAPFFNCVFIAFIDILKGRPMMIPFTIQRKFAKTMLANYALWPLAHVINFRFVPSKQRILYINAIQICWTTYLSYLVGSKLH